MIPSHTHLSRALSMKRSILNLPICSFLTVMNQTHQTGKVNLIRNLTKMKILCAHQELMRRNVKSEAKKLTSMISIKDLRTTYRQMNGLRVELVSKKKMRYLNTSNWKKASIRTKEIHFNRNCNSVALFPCNTIC